MEFSLLIVFTLACLNLLHGSTYQSRATPLHRNNHYTDDSDPTSVVTQLLRQTTPLVVPTSDPCVAPVPHGEEKDIRWPWRVNMTQIRSLRENVEKASFCVPSVSDHRTVIMAVVDRGFHDMFDSYIFFLRHRAHINRTLFISLDRVTHTKLLRKGLPSFFSDDLGNMGEQHSDLFTDSWLRKGQYKFKVATMIVNMGFSVLMNDLDVTYLRNPFDRLEKRDYDIALSRDYNAEDSPYNAGFVYFRATQRSKQFLNTLSGILEQNHRLWDQDVLNHMIFKESKAGSVTKLALAFNEFAPGLVYKESDFSYYDPSEVLTNKMYTLHHIYVDYRGKIYRMKELGLWMLNKNGYYTDSDAKYMTYTNPEPTLQHEEYEALENAFKIAKILKRILILPKFHCKKTRRSPAMFFQLNQTEYSIGKQYCSLFHLLQDKHKRYEDKHLLTEYEKLHPERFYRESTFLRHPLVPDSIKRSVSGYMLINSDVNLHVSSFYNTERTFNPKVMKLGASAQEISAWMMPFDRFSVIRFQSFYGNFDI